MANASCTLPGTNPANFLEERFWTTFEILDNAFENDIVHYHAQSWADKPPKGLCPIWRPIARVDCRHEMLSVTFLDPGAFLSTECSRHVRVPLLNFSLPNGPDACCWED